MSKKPEKKIKTNKKFKYLTYLKKYKKLCFWGPFFKAVEALTEVIIPFMMAFIIDEYIASGNKKMIWTMSAVIIGLNVIGIICACLGQKFASVTSESVGRDMRDDIFTHISTFSHAELDKYSTTALLNRTIFDVYHLQEGTSMILRVVMRAPFLFIGSTIMAMIVDIKLSLIFLVVVPILLGIIFAVMKKLEPLLVESKARVDKTSKVTRENLSGVRVVRAFNKQLYEEERFKNTNGALTEIQLKEGRLSALLQPLIFMIVQISKNLNAIVWLYRGETDKYEYLLVEYRNALLAYADTTEDKQLEKILRKSAKIAKIFAELKEHRETLRAQAKTAVEAADKKSKKKTQEEWDARLAELDEIIGVAKEADWLYEKFGDGKYKDILGLCKIATRAEIAEKNYSLTPGAYVGVAPVEDDGVDFAERMTEIHAELLKLQDESNALMKTISKNMKEMGL